MPLAGAAACRAHGSAIPRFGHPIAAFPFLQESGHDRDLRTVLLAAAGLAALSASAQAALPPAPAQAVPVTPGPDVRVKITDEYAALVAPRCLFRAWPLVNIYNRRLAVAKLAKTVRSGSAVSAPLNRLGMLTD